MWLKLASAAPPPRCRPEVRPPAPSRCAAGLEQRPIAIERVVALVHARPAETEGGSTLALDAAAVDVALDGDEAEASCVPSFLDKGGTHEVNAFTVSEIHLDDAPPPGNGKGHARRP